MHFTDIYTFAALALQISDSSVRICNTHPLFETGKQLAIAVCVSEYRVADPKPPTKPGLPRSRPHAYRVCGRCTAFAQIARTSHIETVLSPSLHQFAHEDFAQMFYTQLLLLPQTPTRTTYTTPPSSLSYGLQQEPH